MQTSLRISSWIRIKPGSIDQDGQRIFTDNQTGDAFLNQAYKHFLFKNPRFYKMDPLSKCGFLAAGCLLQSPLEHEVPVYKKGMVFQNRSSSLETDRKFQQSIRDIASPALFVYTLPNIVMGEIAIQHGFKGENTFFVAPQFDPAALHAYAEMLFQQGILKLALTGYIEYLNGEPDILLCRVQATGQWPFTVPQLEQFYHTPVAETT